MLRYENKIRSLTLLFRYRPLLLISDAKENTCNSCLSLFLLSYDSVVVLIMASNFRNMHDSDFVLGLMLCGKFDVLAWRFLCLVYNSDFVVLWIFFSFLNLILGGLKVLGCLRILFVWIFYVSPLLRGPSLYIDVLELSD